MLCCIKKIYKASGPCNDLHRSLFNLLLTRFTILLLWIKMKKLCCHLVSQTFQQVMVNSEGKKRKQVKPEPWIKKKENSLGREYSNWYNNHRIIQIRCGRMELGLRPPEATALQSQGVQDPPASVPCLPSLASCHMLTSLHFAFMHFNDATIFLTQFVYFTTV